MPFDVSDTKITIVVTNGLKPHHREGERELSVFK
jgi:hypothetical protein